MGITNEPRIGRGVAMFAMSGLELATSIEYWGSSPFATALIILSIPLWAFCYWTIWDSRGVSLKEPL